MRRLALFFGTSCVICVSVSGCGGGPQSDHVSAASAGLVGAQGVGGGEIHEFVDRSRGTSLALDLTGRRACFAHPHGGSGPLSLGRAMHVSGDRCSLRWRRGPELLLAQADRRTGRCWAQYVDAATRQRYRLLSQQVTTGDALGECQTNLRRISGAILMYYADYDDRFPDAGNWQDKVDPYLKNPQLFVCPASWLGDASYVYNPVLGGRSLQSIPQPEISPMLWDAGFPVGAGPHIGGWNVALCDGHVKLIQPAEAPGYPTSF